MLCRLIRRQDLPRFAEMLSPGFRIPDRLRASLPGLWRDLLRGGQISGTVVVEDGPADADALLAFGMTTFVSDRFLESYLASPRPFLSAVVYEALLAGESPILDPKRIAAANTAGDLNLLMLHFGIRHDNPGDDRGRAILATAHAGFRTVHQGYRIRRVLQEAYAPELPFFKAGGFVVKSDYAEADTGSESAPDWRPYLMGLFREDPESRIPGSAMSYLFQVLGAATVFLRRRTGGAVARPDGRIRRGDRRRAAGVTRRRQENVAAHSPADRCGGTGDRAADALDRRRSVDRQRNVARQGAAPQAGPVP